jgi:Preprotein translocase subunit SecD
MAAKKYLKDFRILSLIAIVVILAIFDYHYGLHLGIEFAGGTQIPITLQHSVNPAEMANITSILQQRLSTFGLKEIQVTGIGDSQVQVEIPTVSPSEINDTINIINSQGIFQGVINGKEAINGSSILSGSVGAAQPIESGGNVTWQVNFYITTSAAQKFAKVAFGQANKPIYFFLDRPTSAIMLLNASTLQGNLSLSQTSELSVLQNTLLLDGNSILIKTYAPGQNYSPVYAFLNSSRATHNLVLLAYNTPNAIVQDANSLNYTLSFHTPQNITPTIGAVQANITSTEYIVNTWPAVGLLSAPILNPGVTNGNISQGYIISGAAPSTLPFPGKVAYAENQSKTITSILQGGALPVLVIVGTPTVTPPTIGSQFESVSLIALIIAVLAISVIIVFRYKRLFLIAPILLTTFAELFIILSIIGLVGTIDLAAVAGIIAVIGTGVDAQIIITDELLVAHGSDPHMIKTRLGDAFYIVWADAGLLVIAMLPLFFSTSLISVIGFSESTIIGALLGAFLTRPTYGSIISKHYSK